MKIVEIPCGARNVKFTTFRERKFSRSFFKNERYGNISKVMKIILSKEKKKIFSMHYFSNKIDRNPFLNSETFVRSFH